MGGVVSINGNVFMGHGSKLSVGKDAMLTIGKGFVNTAEGTIICHKEITIGNDVLTSWNTTIMDADFHRTINLASGDLSITEKPVQIGNNVWIGMNSAVLKGIEIPEGCVVAANSVVAKSFKEQNCLVAGNPAIIKKHNITRFIDST